MEPRRESYRVKLLGELVVCTADGEELVIPADRVMRRLLIAMALRAGQPRRTDDLVAAVWPGDKAFGRDAKSLETPASRLRNKLMLPIPARRGEGFYKLDVGRAEVDALDFIDRVQENDLDHAGLDRLLGLWRGNPQVLHGDVPVYEWEQLDHAVDHLVGRLSELNSRDLGGLRNFRAFAQLFPEKTSGLRPADATSGRRSRRILIVENEIEIANTMKAILFEHHCTIATNLEDAMDVLIASIDELDGAVIDLHLTSKLDSAGLEILSFIRDRRPELPRLLITASPPAGSQEQMRKTFGLFDIVVKGADGYSASGVRDAVTHMLGEEESGVRRRALAHFESLSVQLQRTLNRKLIAARRAMRSGREDAYGEIDYWSTLIERFDEDCDTMRERLAGKPAVVLDALVEEFSQRWRNAVDFAVPDETW
jgi:DNA-binding response OmpR family regulator